MILKKFYLISYIITISLCIQYILAQQRTEVDDVRDVSMYLNDFALKLLHETTEYAGDKLNLAISPYTVWSLLTVISEGARGNTGKQLKNALSIPPNIDINKFRSNYQKLTKYLAEYDDSSQLDLSSAIFTTVKQKLQNQFEAIVKNYYNITVTPTDFSNNAKAANSINSYVAAATKNVITNLVRPDDFKDTEIFLVSTLFFKGQWKMPFNRSATRVEDFLDTSGTVKGQVKMMYQTGTFPYVVVQQLQAYAIQLPYGKGDRFSMIVILPRRNESLTNVLRNFARVGFSTVLNSLEMAERDYGDEDVQVYLPRFTTYSDFSLNSILVKMGVTDLFDYSKADLLGMFPEYVAVSNILQQSKIEVNEEGTVAASAGAANIGYKSPPPKFLANHDFAYFIVEKPTNSIIFCGKISNPNTLL